MNEVNAIRFTDNTTRCDGDQVVKSVFLADEHVGDILEVPSGGYQYVTLSGVQGQIYSHIADCQRSLFTADQVSLFVDRHREDMDDMTGCYVRAQTFEGHWVSVDIACLEKSSLITWLQGREGRMLNVVLHVLGYDIEANAQGGIYREDEN